MVMLFNKLTLISIAVIISIASILVFIIPTDSIETQSLINNETQSVINSEKPPINHTLSLDQSISVSEANNRVAINLFKLLENDTQKNIFFSPFSILTAMTIGYENEPYAHMFLDHSPMRSNKITRKVTLSENTRQSNRTAYSLG